MLSEGPAKRVLVVDDDEEVLGSMKVLLEVAGFCVGTARNREEAIKEIEDTRYDLMILDVTMPMIDGTELFQEIKNTKRCKDVPVVFTSGYPIWTEPEERRRKIFGQAEAYMQKPFNIEVFIATVRRLAGGGVPADGGSFAR